jgi:hypothetical protein
MSQRAWRPHPTYGVRAPLGRMRRCVSEAGGVRRSALAHPETVSAGTSSPGVLDDDATGLGDDHEQPEEAREAMTVPPVHDNMDDGRRNRSVDAAAPACSGAGSWRIRSPRCSWRQLRDDGADVGNTDPSRSRQIRVSETVARCDRSYTVYHPRALPAPHFRVIIAAARVVAERHPNTRRPITSLR